MRGHEVLIGLRMRGFAPVQVFVSDGGDTLKAWRDWHQWTTHPHVEIDPKDRPRRLDLRFAAGLIVHLDAANSQRLDELSDALISAGARRVIGATYRPGRLGPEADRFIVKDHPEATWQN